MRLICGDAVCPDETPNADHTAQKCVEQCPAGSAPTENKDCTGE